MRIRSMEKLKSNMQACVFQFVDLETLLLIRKSKKVAFGVFKSVFYGDNCVKNVIDLHLRDFKQKWGEQVSNNSFKEAFEHLGKIWQAARNEWVNSRIKYLETNDVSVSLLRRYKADHNLTRMDAMNLEMCAFWPAKGKKIQYRKLQQGNGN